MSRVAVVILNYNGKHYLEQFLPAIVRHSQHARVIVADNASTDGSVPFLKTHYSSSVERIVLDKNHGFADGYNKALANIDADYFVMVNSDVEVTEGWLGPVVDFLEGHKEYGACQPKILDYHRKDHFEYAGACGGFIDQLGYPYCRGRVFDSLERDHGQYNQEIDIFWATGACLVIRAQIFKDLGGFDSDFFAHMEEIDLCWRLQSAGYKVRSVPSSTVYHVGGGTLSRQGAFKTYLNFRNGLFLLLKNLPKQSLLWILPVRLGLDWAAALMYLVNGRGNHTLAIFRAHIAFFRSFHKTANKRTSFFHIRPKVFSIIFSYFLKRKKKYKDYQ